MESSNRGSPSYYSILGVGFDSSDDQIRRAYRKLAMQWHPDKWAKNPSLLGEAKAKFQQIQEAYSVLSDQSKRTMYDAGLYDPLFDDDDEEEGFGDFLQEMVSLMDTAKNEEKKYSFGEIQSMFWEMAQSFDTTEWSDFPRQTPNGPQTPGDSRTPKRAKSDGNPFSGEDSGFRYGTYEADRSSLAH